MPPYKRKDLIDPNYLALIAGCKQWRQWIAEEPRGDFTERKPTALGRRDSDSVIKPA